MNPLSTTEAAEQLSVVSRMVRYYIEQGIKTPTGTLKLKAKLLTNRMYVLNQKDVEKFRIMRDSLKK